MSITIFWWRKVRISGFLSPDVKSKRQRSFAYLGYSYDKMYTYNDLFFCFPLSHGSIRRSFDTRTRNQETYDTKS